MNPMQLVRRIYHTKVNTNAIRYQYVGISNIIFSNNYIELLLYCCTCIVIIFTLSGRPEDTVMMISEIKKIKKNEMVALGEERRMIHIANIHITFAFSSPMQKKKLFEYGLYKRSSFAQCTLQTYQQRSACEL